MLQAPILRAPAIARPWRRMASGYGLRIRRSIASGGGELSVLLSVRPATNTGQSGPSGFTAGNLPHVCTLPTATCVPST